MIPTLDGTWRLGAGDGGYRERLAGGRWTALQIGGDRAAYRVDTSEGPVFTKTYAPRGWTGRVRDFALRRKPQRAFHRGLALRAAGVGTPEPLALFLRGRFVAREALLVCAWLPVPRSWFEEVMVASPLAHDPRGFRAALEEFGLLLGRLHAQGWYHGDLRANVLFGGAEEGRRRAQVIDLEDLWGCLSQDRRLRNLESLARTAEDLMTVPLRERWRFLRAYARAAGLEPPHARALWRSVRNRLRVADSSAG